MGSPSEEASGLAIDGEREVTRGELLSEVTLALGDRRQARIIVEDVLGAQPSSARDVVDHGCAARIRGLAERCTAGEPLPYVLGHRSFRNLDLLVDRRAMIPRPETALIVERGMEELRHLGTTAPNVVDAGTGSGIVALSLASELIDACPDGRIWATDISPDALAVAAANRDRHLLVPGNVLLPITFLPGHWLECLPDALRHSVDLIVSSPPYLDEGDWEHLPSDVRSQPRQSVVARAASDGTPGLGEFEVLVSQLEHWLAPLAVAVIEVPPQTAAAARGLAQSMGCGDVQLDAGSGQGPQALIVRIH